MLTPRYPEAVFKTSSHVAAYLERNITMLKYLCRAIEIDKQLLAKRQDAIAAIERALTDKDELTGAEVHQILDNLTDISQVSVVEVTS